MYTQQYSDINKNTLILIFEDKFMVNVSLNLETCTEVCITCDINVLNIYPLFIYPRIPIVSIYHQLFNILLTVVAPSILIQISSTESVSLTEIILVIFDFVFVFYLCVIFAHLRYTHMFIFITNFIANVDRKTVSLKIELFTSQTGSSQKLTVARHR